MYFNAAFLSEASARAALERGRFIRYVHVYMAIDGDHRERSV
jgi:hypothetical protein